METKYFTVTLIHKDGKTNVTRDYDDRMEAEINYNWHVDTLQSRFPGTYRPIVAIAMHTADNPVPEEFHRFS